jgi:hypothetical protein
MGFVDQHHRAVRLRQGDHLLQRGNVAEHRINALEEIVRREMGAAASLAVPLDVSVGTGHSWHDAAH